MDEAAPAAALTERPAQAAPGGSGLREAVLTGRFFGPARKAEALALSAFLHGGDVPTLSDWFGLAAAARLAADPDACRGALDRDIAAIDALIAEQLDAVLHHWRLRRLEGSWRGLVWLIASTDGSSRTKIKLVGISWAELCRDLERAAEFDQSQLFKKIYEQEFGTPGGEPYGLLVIDHEIRHRPGSRSGAERASAVAMSDDVTAIATLAGVAAAAFVPTVLSASPALLDVDEFADLAMVADLSAPFRGPDYTRWRTLAGREDMRFVAVTLPRVLGRPPWEDDPARADGFRYAEHAPDAASRVWVTAGYAFAATVLRAFANHAWPADVRGSETDREGGGLVTDLPVEPFRTDPDRVWIRPPLDVVLTDRQERALVDAGLMPLSVLPFGEEAVFSAVRSLQAPGQFIGANAAAANANARLSSQLNSMLCVSRFAHYLKVMGRDMVGSFRTAEEIEHQLQSWLRGYVNGNLSGGADGRARYPLVDGTVTVRERPGQPGVFGCTIALQPHFQLDDVAATFRLVTDIAAPGAR